MPSLSRSALLPFPPHAVYQIVADIERYPEFLPWCTAAQVVSRSDAKVTAALEFAVRGLRDTLVTENSLQPGQRMTLELVSGPFAQFRGVWAFAELGAQAEACKTKFQINYKLNKKLTLFAAPLVNQAADRLVDAFADRCSTLLAV